jgi:hypothetical protein
VVTLTPDSSVPPNVLILSNPRSGSSWLGSVMANSSIVDYRREPILQHRSGKVSDAFGASSGLTPEEQNDLRVEVALAFADRNRPTVIVKEVTPLLIDDLLRPVDAQVVYLRRHPLAIALSHLAQGWPPHSRLPGRAGIGAHERETLQTMWQSGSDVAKLVAYIAAVESSIRDRLERIGTIMVSYEQLSMGDLGDVTPLFDSLRLDARDLASPSADAERTDAYGVGSSRKSTSADAVSSDVLQQAREAWMAFNPVSYREDTDWILPTA